MLRRLQCSRARGVAVPYLPTTATRSHVSKQPTDLLDILRMTSPSAPLPAKVNLSGTRRVCVGPFHAPGGLGVGRQHGDLGA
jgi:hypothetical protein